MPPMLLAPFAFTLLSAGAVQIDPEAVVRESESLLSRANTVRGAYTVVTGTGIGRVDFAIEKPYQLSIRSASKIEVFNGAQHVIASVPTGTYETRSPEVYGTPYVIGFTGFLRDTPDRKLSRPTFAAPTVVQVDGRTFVRRTTEGSGSRMSYDIDPATKLPARWSWTTGAQSYSAAFEDVVLDGPVESTLFDVEAAKVGRNRMPTAQESALPASGSIAPEFEGKTVSGRRFSLAEYVKERRATVLAFVDPRSLGSANGLTSLGDLVRRNGFRDVGVVAIVRSNDARASKDLVRKFGSEATTLDAATAEAGTSTFGVRLAPTFIVLNEAGAVVASTVGYDGEALTAALRPSLSG